MGKTEQLHVRNRKLEHSLTPYTKINLKWIKNLYVRPDTIKTLRIKHKQNTLYINSGNIFFKLSPRVMEVKTKINRWDLIKLKSVYTAKETINKMK